MIVFRWSVGVRAKNSPEVINTYIESRVFSPEAVIRHYADNYGAEVVWLVPLGEYNIRGRNEKAV